MDDDGLADGVLERLAECGYALVQPVTTANETLVFALPREIRRSATMWAVERPEEKPSNLRGRGA